jgi:hypothetical protein
MALETATYIDGLVVTNPLGTDAKSQGDDHIRLLKSTIKATFPNVTGAVTPTHTELNYVDGVTSAIQTQIDSKGAITGQAWTGAHTFASTVDITGAVATGALTVTGAGSFTGAVTGVTASPGDNTTKFATTAFATQLAFQAVLPVQTGETGKFLQTDGSAASWQNISNLKSAKSAAYTVIATDRYKHFVLTGTDTLTLTAAATLGDGFIFYTRNDGTGVWTIDPNSAETIDGAAALDLLPGDSCAVICDGANWRTFGLQSRWRQVGATTTIAAPVATVDFTALPDGAREAMLVCDDLSHNDGSGQTMTVAVRTGASTWSAVLAVSAAGGSGQDTDMTVLFSMLDQGLVSILGVSSNVVGADAYGGVRAGPATGLRVSVAAGSLDGGTVKLFCR